MKNKKPRKTRNLDVVLGQIIDCIPKSEETLVDDFNRIKHDLLYTPPECIKDMWMRAEELINEVLPPPNKLNAWQLKIAEVWIDDKIKSIKRRK